MHLLRQTWLLTRNDLRQELRQLELVVTAGFFTLVVLIMFALAFSTLDDEVQPRAVPGMIWLCLAFVGALTLDVGCRLQRATTTTILAGRRRSWWLPEQLDETASRSSDA